MLISEKWLREWAPVDLTHDQLCQQLTMLGLEIGTVEPAAPLFGDKIVVGYIEQATPHENADRLQLCKVNVGSEDLLSIVCGAKNARVGIYVAVAIEGAKLPDLEVKHSQIRGVDSFGMLCSFSELGLAENSDGIAELDEYPLGLSIDQYFDSDDSVLEVELTPNRGDCLSVLGVARDLAAVSSLPIPALPEIAVGASIESTLPIDLLSEADCPRYVGRCIENIDIQAKTPVWMTERLRRSGLRSINPVVDVTNYVMLELGQPMHAFDLTKLQGGIVVRRAVDGEQLVLLDDSTVMLNNTNLVIADHSKPVALAGIMGGANSCVDGATNSIYLESAFFSQNIIAGKARELGKHTDSSHRFERGVDFNLQQVAIERATQLILEIAGGVAGPVHGVTSESNLPKLEPIYLPSSQIKRILGIELDSNQIISIFNQLGMPSKIDGDGYIVNPPSWRYDVRAAHDLVEEIARCYGLNKIEARLPLAQASRSQISESDVEIDDIKLILTRKGYFEAINYSFVDPNWQQKILGHAEDITLLNPIAENMSVMRRSLFPGLLSNLQYNLHRQQSTIRLFEIGNVFYLNNQGQSDQINMIAGVAMGSSDALHWSQAERVLDFFDIKGDALSVVDNTLKNNIKITRCDFPFLHPGQSALWSLDEETIGVVGKIHPALAELCDLPSNIYMFEWQLAPLLSRDIPKFSPISRFPSVQRDLALIVDAGLPVEELVNSAKKVAGELLTHFELFDMYQGEHIEKDKKSLAFRFTFQANNASLKTEDIDQLQAQILQHLEHNYAAKLRA